MAARVQGPLRDMGRTPPCSRSRSGSPSAARARTGTAYSAAATGAFALSAAARVQHWPAVAAVANGGGDSKSTGGLAELWRATAGSVAVAMAASPSQPAELNMQQLEAGGVGLLVRASPRTAPAARADGQTKRGGECDVCRRGGGTWERKRLADGAAMAAVALACRSEHGILANMAHNPLVSRCSSGQAGPARRPHLRSKLLPGFRGTGVVPARSTGARNNHDTGRSRRDSLMSLPLA